MSEQTLSIEQEAALILAEMARLKRENLEATKEQRAAVATLESETDIIRGQIDDINLERDAVLAELETRAKELGLRAEQTIKTDHGSINFRRGYPKVTYDAKQLDAVAKMPDHEWILVYRTMTEVGPSVTVTVVKDSK